MKVLGIWESPVWQQLIPYAAGIFTFGVFYQSLFDMKRQLVNVQQQLKNVVKDTADIKIKTGKIETKIEYMYRDIGLLRSDFEVSRA